MKVIISHVDYPSDILEIIENNADAIIAIKYTIRYFIEIFNYEIIDDIDTKRCIATNIPIKVVQEYKDRLDPSIITVEFNLKNLNVDMFKIESMIYFSRGMNTMKKIFEYYYMLRSPIDALADYPSDNNKIIYEIKGFPQPTLGLVYVNNDTLSSTDEDEPDSDSTISNIFYD